MLPPYAGVLINSATTVYMLPESAAPGTTKLTSISLLLEDLSTGIPPNSLKSQ